MECKIRKMLHQRPGKIVKIAMQERNTEKERIRRKLKELPYETIGGRRVEYLEMRTRKRHYVKMNAPREQDDESVNGLLRSGREKRKHGVEIKKSVVKRHIERIREIGGWVVVALLICLGGVDVLAQVRHGI